MAKFEIVTDDLGNKVVLIPEIIFKNKQNIDWNEVEDYLLQYVGEIVTITESDDVVYVGKDFPDEFTGSNYTRRMKGARAKAKANAAQGILDMVEIATDRVFVDNQKEKHKTDAANGWYYYTTRFAMPVYNNDEKTGEYNVYSGRLVVNCSNNGKMYLYDLVEIKKEASNPLKTTK